MRFSKIKFSISIFINWCSTLAEMATIIWTIKLCLQAPGWFSKQINHGFWLSLASVSTGTRMRTASTCETISVQVCTCVCVCVCGVDYHFCKLNNQQLVQLHFIRNKDSFKGYNENLWKGFKIYKIRKKSFTTVWKNEINIQNFVELSNVLSLNNVILYLKD